MTKVLFILSAIAMLCATVFAYQNGRAFAAAREDKATVHRKITTERRNLLDSVGEVERAATSVKTAQGEVDVENEKLKQTNLKVVQLEGDTKRTAEELAEKTKKLEALRNELAQLPPGMKVETLTENMNTLRKETAELQTQAEEKGKEVSAEAKNLEDARKVLAELVAKVESRKKAFERNAMSANVIAVNADWGFVVVNAGEKQGITQDTKLLVCRGTQTVGKLNVLSVQGGRTVANILTDTLAPGMSPTPGDQVILENLSQ